MSAMMMSSSSTTHYLSTTATSSSSNRDGMIRTTSIICLGWWLLYMVLGGSDFGHDFYKDFSGVFFDDKKGGVALVTIAFPLFISSSVAFLLRSPTATSITRPSPPSSKKPSNMKMNLLSFLLIGLPCIIYCASSIQRHLAEYEHKKHKEEKKHHDKCRFLHDDDEHDEHEDKKEEVKDCCTRFLHSGHSHDDSEDDNDICHHFLRFLHEGHDDDDVKDCCNTRFLHDNHNDDNDDKKSQSKIPHPLDDQLMDVANTFGTTAMLAISYLPFIPTSRYSILLSALFPKVNEVELMNLHIWCTRICVWGVFVHGTMHMYRWVVLAKESLVTMLIPTRACWKLAIFGSGGGVEQEHHDDRRILHEGHDEAEAEEASGNLYSLAPACHDPESECTCYDIFRNLTGFLALLLLLLLFFSSLYKIRRAKHLLFYSIHLLSGPMVMIMMVLHWNRMVLFLAPGILYYLGCTVPHKMYWWMKRRNGKSVRVLSVQELCRFSGGGGTANNDGGGEEDDEEGEFANENTEHISNNNNNNNNDRACVALTFEVSPETMKQYTPGQYIRLCAPDIEGFGSHPFTVNRVPTDDDDDEEGSVVGEPRDTKNKVGKMEITFRCFGPFTQKLRAALVQQQNELSSTVMNTNPTPPMTLLIDGFFGNAGKGGLYSKALQHESVVLIAGGVGITPYLSLLADLVSAFQKEEVAQREEMKRGDLRASDIIKRKVTLHWICRDDALMDYMIHRHFVPLVQSSSASSSSSKEEMGLISQDDKETSSVSTPFSFLKIVVHDTSSTSVPSSGLSSNGLELPSSASLNSRTSDYEDSSSSRNNSNSSNNRATMGKTEPMSSSFYSSSDGSFSISANLPHFLTFAATTYVGLGIVWICYRTIQDKHKVGSRFWGIFIAMIWSFIPSMMLLFVMKRKEEGRSWCFCFGNLRRHEGKRFESILMENGSMDEGGEEENGGLELANQAGYSDEKEKEMNGGLVANNEDDGEDYHDSSAFVIDDDDDEEGDDNEDHGANGSAPSHINKTTMSNASPSMVSMERSRGRPDIRTILNEGLMSEQQNVSRGVFSCGPTPMMDLVREVVHGMSSGCFKSCGIRGNVTLYEEAFEM